MLTATDRYIARLIALPLIGTLVIAAMLFTLDQMLRLFDFVAAEGGPVSVVWRMLANQLPEYLGLAIPIGLLLGTLLAFRKLALSSELDVFQAVGMGYARLLRVPYIFAVVLMGVNIAIVGFIQPNARYAYERLEFELRSGALGASINVGEFTSLGDDLTLRIEESRDRGRELSGIFVRASDESGQTVSASAERGTFLATSDLNTIVFRLTNGTLVHDSPSFGTPRVLSFSQHDLPIDLPQLEAFRARGDSDRELTIPELVRTGRAVDTPVVTRNEIRANFHFRVVEIASMLLLPLLAVALAVPPKRSTSGLGVFLSIVIVVTYHKVNEYGESLAALGRAHPLVSLWLPFLVFALGIFWMYRTLAFVPGGEPIGTLERGFGKLGKLVKRGMPGAGARARRRAAAAAG